MVSTPDWPANKGTAARLIAQAAAAGAQLVLLPEYFCVMGRRDTDKLALAEAPDTTTSSPIQQFLSTTAREHSLWLVGGTLPVVTAVPTQALNRCCVFAPDGTPASHYDKVHLFAFDNGHESYDEGRTLIAGSQPVALQAGLFADGDRLRVGLSMDAEVDVSNQGGKALAGIESDADGFMQAALAQLDDDELASTTAAMKKMTAALRSARPNRIELLHEVFDGSHEQRVFTSPWQMVAVHHGARVQRQPVIAQQRAVVHLHLACGGVQLHRAGLHEAHAGGLGQRAQCDGAIGRAVVAGHQARHHA